MLLTISRSLIWASIALVLTTVSAAPTPDLVRDERGFYRLNYGLAALPDPLRQWRGEGMSDMLRTRLRGPRPPPLDTSMQHFCLPPLQRNRPCLRCDDLYVRPVADENLSKVGGIVLVMSPRSDMFGGDADVRSVQFARCATNRDGMGCSGREGKCTTMDTMRMYESYAVRVAALQ